MPLEAGEGGAGPVGAAELRRALADGAKIHGATVHHVIPEPDSGAIIAQAALAVNPEDTAATLAARVLTLEHTLYPAAIRTLVTGRAPGTTDATLFSPPPAAG